MTSCALQSDLRCTKDEILDENVPLSLSGVWKWQREQYRAAGGRVWSENAVPFEGTNSAWLAHAYADIVFAYLRDCIEMNSPKAKSTIMPEPVYILDLGAGSGKLCRLLLPRLIDLMAEVPSLCGIRVVYILTDIAEDCIERWQETPGLMSLFAIGVLQAAVFDSSMLLDPHMSDSTAITLQPSGVQIDVGKVGAPLIAIANYFFSVIEADIFEVRMGGTLAEELVRTTIIRESVVGATSEAVSALSKSLIVRLSSSRTISPARRYPCEDDAALTRLVTGYTSYFGSLGRDVDFSVPLGACRVIRWLLNLTVKVSSGLLQQLLSMEIDYCSNCFR